MGTPSDVRHPIDDDDRPIGRVLTRREALALLGHQGGGDQLLLTPTADGGGYVSTMEIGVQVD